MSRERGHRYQKACTSLVFTSCTIAPRVFIIFIRGLTQLNRCSAIIRNTRPIWFRIVWFWGKVWTNFSKWCCAYFILWKGKFDRCKGPIDWCEAAYYGESYLSMKLFNQFEVSYYCSLFWFVKFSDIFLMLFIWFFVHKKLVRIEYRLLYLLDII